MQRAENNPDPGMVLRRLRRVAPPVTGGPVDAGLVVRYGATIGSVIECHPELPRAMERARRLIAQEAREGRAAASGTVILADSLSHCRGRFAREWHAPPGGVWGCLVYASTLLPESRNFIPLAAGVACCEAVRESGAADCGIRWVNDVLCGGKKLAGFLVESYVEPVNGEEFALIGFGINVNNTSFPDELSGTAVSLAQVLNRPVDLTAFTALFLARLAWNFGLVEYEEARGLAGDAWSGRNGQHMLLERWQELSDSVGRRVVYGFDVMTAPQYQATVLGVDGAGGLILRLDDGCVKTEFSGEIRYLDR